MPAQATVTVDLAKIAENTRRVVAALPGIDVVAVTKVTCGSPQVARAMLAGGASALGESRLENAARLRDAGIAAPIWLVRTPVPELADEAVRVSDVSVVSELAVVDALDARRPSAPAARYGVLVMVDIGDLREGMMPDELPAFLECAERYRAHRRHRHRREPDLLRRHRPRRAQPRPARGAPRRSRGAAGPQAHHLRRQLHLARPRHPRPCAGKHQQPADRRGDRARRGPGHARADSRSRAVHRRGDPLGTGHRVQAQAEQADRHQRAGRLWRLAGVRGSRPAPPRSLRDWPTRRAARGADAARPARGACSVHRATTWCSTSTSCRRAR